MSQKVGNDSKVGKVVKITGTNEPYQLYFKEAVLASILVQEFCRVYTCGALACQLFLHELRVKTRAQLQVGHNNIRDCFLEATETARKNKLPQSKPPSARVDTKTVFSPRTYGN